MKVYTAPYYDGTVPHHQQVHAIKLYSELDHNLTKNGYEILSFATKDLPFDPHLSDVDKFIDYSDFAISLLDPPLLGFSEQVTNGLIRKRKPGFCFTRPGVVRELQIQNRNFPFIRFIAFEKMSDVLEHLTPEYIALAQTLVKEHQLHVA